MNVKIENSWKEAIADEFEKPYFANLVEFVRKEYASGICYPREILFSTHSIIVLSMMSRL